MAGRRRAATRRPGLRWIAAAVGLGAAAGAVIVMTPASAGSVTVNAQLSLSGVATKGNILGGTTIGIHPGDSVDFKASALPTAGLDNIPSLGPLLNDVLDKLLGSQFQVTVHLPASFPGGDRDVKLGGPTKGPCIGVSHLPVNFPDKGTFQFTWSVHYVLPGLLGGCTEKALNNANLNLLKTAGIALNASNQWVGQIIVADNPPPPGISIQLPGLTLAPSVGPLGQLPTLALPTIALPTIPVNVGSLPSLPGGGGTSGGGSSGGNCVPCSVVPSPGNFPGGFGDPGLNNDGITQIGNGLESPIGGGLPPVTATATNPSPTTSTSTIALPKNTAPAAQMPVILAIIAIIALSLVTATYARLYLLRREA